jgi:hypothetical protein
MRPDGTPWLAALTQGAPKLDMDNMQQIAALPLNSRLKIDPWDDKVTQLHFTAPVLLNARDKMPLEITPVYYKLERYQQPGTAPANATPAAGNAAPPPSADAGPAQPSNNAQSQPQAQPQPQ